MKYTNGAITVPDDQSCRLKSINTQSSQYLKCFPSCQTKHVASKKNTASYLQVKGPKTVKTIITSQNKNTEKANSPASYDPASVPAKTCMKSA